MGNEIKARQIYEELLTLVPDNAEVRARFQK